MNLNNKKIASLLGILLILTAIVILKSTKQAPKHKIISGIVVPHHNLVQDVRKNFLQSITQKISQPDTIILVSPNHFAAGARAIQTTNQVWRLSNGLIMPNLKVLSALKKINVSDEPQSFVDEHGIKNILSDLKKYFPTSKIVPIIIKNTTTILEMEALQTTLKQTCVNCLLIASVDFSHNQTTKIANEHDKITINALENLDINKIITQAEVDSPPTLALFIKWAQTHNTKNFNLWAHTNSGEITKKPESETTSHVFGYYDNIFFSAN